LGFVLRRQFQNLIVERQCGSARLECFLLPEIGPVLAPDPLGQSGDGAPQQIAEGGRLRPLLRKSHVEQSDIGGQLPDLTAPGFIRALCRCDQQAEHKSGHRPDQPCSQPRDTLCIAALVMPW
jgi:hypothetical protein